jgi:hypothetical protein
MTQLRENKYLLLDYCNGIIGADFSAFATIGAFCLVYFGDREEYRLALVRG